jgi:hypothetical protein
MSNLRTYINAYKHSYIHTNIMQAGIQNNKMTLHVELEKGGGGVGREEARVGVDSGGRR